MEIIDLNHLQSLGGLGLPELVEIIEDFLNALDDDVTRLEQLATEGREEDFRAAAHRLKGAAQMSGFPTLGALAADFEKIPADHFPSLPQGKVLEQLAPVVQAARSAFASALKEPS